MLNIFVELCTYYIFIQNVIQVTVRSLLACSCYNFHRVRGSLQTGLNVTLIKLEFTLVSV